MRRTMPEARLARNRQAPTYPRLSRAIARAPQQRVVGCAMSRYHPKHRRGRCHPSSAMCRSVMVTSLPMTRG